MEKTEKEQDKPSCLGCRFFMHRTNVCGYRSRDYICYRDQIADQEAKNNPTLF